MFFSDLMPCCGSQWRRKVDAPPLAEVEQLRDRQEEVVVRSRHRRRASFASAAAARVKSPGAAAEWRPSLCSISEDCVVPEKRAVRTVARKNLTNSGSANTTRVRVNARSTHYDDSR